MPLGTSGVGLQTRNFIDGLLKTGRYKVISLGGAIKHNSYNPIKTERDTWKTTGNIAIEIRCNGKLSGISTTESSTWIHLLSYNDVIEGGFIINVKKLKERIKKLKEKDKIRIVMGGDNNLSQLVLVPLKEIFELSNEKL